MLMLIWSIWWWITAFWGGISRRQKIAQGIEAFVFEVVLVDKVITRVLLLRSACVLVLR